MYIHTHIYTYIYVYIPSKPGKAGAKVLQDSVCIYVNIFICTYIYINIYVYAHTLIYIYICIYTVEAREGGR